MADLKEVKVNGSTVISGSGYGAFSGLWVAGGASGQLLQVNSSANGLTYVNPLDVQGMSGYSGISGFSGISGWSGQSGISGWSGASGISGWSGASGRSGWSGAKGDTGDAGPSGPQGLSGISGWSGISGYSGKSGFSGISGWSGYSGISGYSGTKGDTGNTGPSGPQGIQGLSGISGWSGTSGYSGKSGWSGAKGDQGDAGPSGPSGPQGLQGISGYSGTSGFSGPAGPSILSAMTVDVDKDWNQKDITNVDVLSADIVQITGTTVIDSSRKIINASIDTNQLTETAYMTGSVTRTGQPLYDVLRADRTAFLPSDQIIIEQSIDGGVTWTAHSASDSSKVGLFSGTRPNINIPLKNGIRDTDCMIRITITGMKYNVPDGTTETEKYQYWNSGYVLSTERYAQLSAGWAFVSSVNDRIYCKIEASTGASPDSWSFLREAYMSGWSGGNFFSLPSCVFGGGTNQVNNQWNWRFTFRTASTSNDFDNAKLSTSSNTSNQGIYHIKLTGPNVWTYSNNMMYNDHLYSWDISKNAYFPAKVTSTELYEGSNRVYSPNNNPAHESLTGLQGGSTNSRYHLTAAEYQAVSGGSYSGYSGYSGISGYSGKSGFSGAKGDTGDIGPSGPSGPQGIQGISGISGYSGKSGWSGAKGDTGDTGPSGPSGPQGAQGLSGISGYSGKSGWSGAKGDTGSTGPSGPSGPQGIQGISGYSGAKGTTGDTGNTGPSGPSGPQGIQGISGISGWSGASGKSGYSGAKGDVGDIGPSGPSGPQGLTGNTGTSGISGWSGKSGWSGATGATGPSGPQGPQGLSGISGWSGQSGYSGQNGTIGQDGASGYSGFSGYSGANGPGIYQITTATAIGTAAKVATFGDGSYVPVTGDLWALTLTAGNNVSTMTLNINGSGAKNIRMNNTNATTTFATITAGATILLYYDGTYYQMMGSQRTTDSDTYDRTYWGNNIVAGAAIYDYKLLGQALDGKFYPFTLETGTGTTKTVSTQEFLINTPILYYATTTDVAVGGTLSNVYSEIITTYLNYTANQASWTAYLPIYLKGTATDHGTFLLDNTSYTSFLTQTLPSTDDGFIYVMLGFMYSTTGIRLFQYHPMYEYKEGGLRTYVEPHSHVYVGIDQPTTSSEGDMWYDTDDTAGASQGESGYSGYSGWSGAIGASGPEGPQGISGISGKSGWSGASGTSGWSGQSGISGWSGASGASGISGYSGFSGPAGSLAINFVIDGGGSAITTGSKGYIIVPFTCTVQNWTVVADVSGSIVVDVKKCTYAGFPTTSSIAGTEKPTLSAVQKNQDTSLSSWTTSISAGDILEFNVDSAATVTRVTIGITVSR